MDRRRVHRLAAGRQTGFTYLALLALVAMLSAVAGATMEVWHTAMQRENERQLLFVGQQFRMAITRYYFGSPGGQRHYPASLDDLIKDPRFPDTRRYLRRIWPDPITNQDDWELVRGPDGGIVGIHSPSQTKPIKVAGFTTEEGAFDGAEHYADWVFSAMPTQPANAAPAGGQGNNLAPKQNNTDVFGRDVFGAPRSGATGRP